MDDKMRALAVMMSSTFKVLAIALTVNLLAALTYGQESKDKLLEDAKATFGIVSAPKQEELDKPIVELGRHLFWDERLSANGKIACASCHAASSWGADAERFSLDAKGKLTKRNSQTVFNSMLQSHLRWTGDRKSGAHQAEKSLTGSMGFTNADDVIALLKLHGYESRFEDAFPSIPGAMTPANYAKAIESYEATLGTPAPFDRYLNGQADALNEEQKQGLRLFMEVGCADCHSGKLLGGESLETFGVHSEYWNATGSDAHDAGLFESKPWLRCRVQASAIWLRAELRVQRNRTFDFIFRALNEGHHVKHFATDLGRTLVISLGFKFSVVCYFWVFVTNRHAEIAAHH